MGKSMPRCDFSAEDLVVRVQHDVPGDVKAIPVVVEEIMDVVRQKGCAHGEFEIKVSLYQALANAVEHGCGQDPDKSVQIVVAFD